MSKSIEKHLSPEQLKALRKSPRLTLEHPCHATCWFNGFFKPYTPVRIINVSRGGMLLFSKQTLKKTSATIRVHSKHSIHGKVLRLYETSKEGFLYGFKSDRTIENETIDDMNQEERYFKALAKEYRDA